MQESPQALNLSPPLQRPLVGAKAIGALIVLHGLLLAWLAYVARTHAYCCDASYYIDASELLLRDGLLHEDGMAGYRSYFVPLVVAVMRRAAALLAPEGPRTIQFAFCALYSGIALVMALWMAGRHGWWRYLAIAVPIFFNPAVWGVLVFPLQEAVAGLLCLPILVWLLAPTRIAGRTRALPRASSSSSWPISSALPGCGSRCRRPCFSDRTPGALARGKPRSPTRPCGWLARWCSALAF